LRTRNGSRGELPVTRIIQLKVKIERILSELKFNHQWYSYLVMGYLVFTIIRLFNVLTRGGILGAVFNGIFIAWSVMALNLTYRQKKEGSMMAIFLGFFIIGLVVFFNSLNFETSANNYIEYIVFIGLGYLEYRRVKSIEGFNPSVATDEQTATEN